MRGKPGFELDSEVAVRIIPAHAGQTPGRWNGHVEQSDHPRACGANAALAARCSARIGSSPRMRGKPGPTRPRPRAGRIIPAHAGQTVCGARSTSVATDHPRACGANPSENSVSGTAIGSSPRMRGKLSAGKLQFAANRIIPAHAGQTIGDFIHFVYESDHPRACGANSIWGRGPPVTCGSSPRMRGKLERVGLLVPLHRIIPAHAGQTAPARYDTALRPDHPRACGANDHDNDVAALDGGSSPRMRGKPVSLAVSSMPMRIIPAHAGQTRVPYTGEVATPDHPRACGANLGGGIVDTAVHGSSPRMRGKRHIVMTVGYILRIIPAHAGQTASR